MGVKRFETSPFDNQHTLLVLCWRSGFDLSLVIWDPEIKSCCSNAPQGRRRDLSSQEASLIWYNLIQRTLLWSKRSAYPLSYFKKSSNWRWSTALAIMGLTIAITSSLNLQISFGNFRARSASWCQVNKYLLIDFYFQNRNKPCFLRRSYFWPHLLKSTEVYRGKYERIFIYTLNCNTSHIFSRVWPLIDR